MEDIEFWMNFVVENSNKLQQIGFKKENELSVFTLGANNTCYLIYPWRKVVCFVLFCHNDISQTTIDVLGYAIELIIKKFSMNRGATTRFKMSGATCGIYWLLNHFFIEFFEKPRLKTILEFGGIIDIVGKSSPSWFIKVDFVILKPKMWTILLNFLWVHFVIKNSNKLQKGVWKENSIECIQTWANDIGYINV